MEPQIPTPTPVPLPTNPTSGLKDFKKSKIILILAYIQLGVYVLSLLGRIVNIGSLLSTSFIYLIPAVLVVLTKNQKVYKIARVFLIIEWLFVPIGLLILFLLFSGGS